MNIIGPDTLVFGVDDVTSCKQYLLDYGLLPVRTDEGASLQRSNGCSRSRSISCFIWPACPALRLNATPPKATG
jgi:hypothetical protein